MTRVHALVLFAALALVAAACGDDSGSDPTTTTATTAAPATTQATAATTTTAGTATTAPAGGAQEVTVLAEGGVYVQEEIHVGVGEVEVTFTDNDLGSDEPHNIHFQIGDDHYFTPINASAPSTETVTFTVDTPGTYNYWCDTHPDTLKGVLIVDG